MGGSGATGSLWVAPAAGKWATREPSSGYDPGMATTPDTYLGQRFAEYAGSWPPADRAAALACRDLEERLAYGLHLYQLVQDRYRADRARLIASGKPYDLPAAKYVEHLLNLWVAPALAAERQIGVMEADGFTVERSAEFREAVLDVRISLSIPVERAAAQAERFARDGIPRGKTTEELRRELRHRMDA